jgi:hypothetical protein
MPTPPNQPDIDPGGVKQRSFNEWMIVAVGLTGLLSILAIIVSVVALSSSDTSADSGTRALASAAPAAAAVAVPAPEAVKLVVKADDQHGRMGPDGKWHDAFQGGDFSAKAGQTVNVTVLNYDGSPHSFNSPSLGVNVTIPAGSDKVPHKVTFTFKAPSTAGAYQWFCALPCDPWAMAHDGYMRGHVTVLA